MKMYYHIDDTIHLYNMDCIQGSKQYIEDNSVDLLIADPPFAIDEKRLKSFYTKFPDKVIQGYVFAPENYQHFCLDWMLQAYRVLKKHGSMYILSGWSYGHIVQAELLKIGFVIINEIIYQYNYPCVAKHKYNSSHFRIYYCKRSKQSRPTFNKHCRYDIGDKDENGKALHYQDMNSVWHIKKEFQHGKKNLTKLPDELVRKILAYSSNENDLVVDLFSGSGTVPVQAHNMNRRVIGFEKNPEAFKHIVAQLKIAERDAAISTPPVK